VRNLKMRNLKEGSNLKKERESWNLNINKKRMKR
jgi:hypothetical protein